MLVAMTGVPWNGAANLSRVIGWQWAPLQLKGRPTLDAHYHFTAHLSLIFAVAGVWTFVHVHGVGRSTERPYLDACMCRAGGAYAYGGRVVFRWERCDSKVLFVPKTCIQPVN